MLFGSSLDQQQPRLDLPPMSNQEQDSLLGRIGGATLGGLGYVGSVLEKTLGGRAIRGLLGGKPRELLSLLPFSDTLGITDFEDRVSGKELLGYDKHDDSWGGMLGGLGLELATDPALYMTFGTSAVSKAGQVARRSGMLPRTVSERATGNLASLAASKPGALGTLQETAKGMGLPWTPALENESLGGVLGLGLPFARPSVLLGTGTGGASFMRGLGAVGSFLGHTMPGTKQLYEGVMEPAGRNLRSLFDPTVREAVTAAGQKTGVEATEAIREMARVSRQKTLGWGEQLNQAGRGGGGGGLREAVEGVGMGPVHPAEASVAAEMRAFLDQKLAQAKQLGVSVGELEDPLLSGAKLGYAPRQRLPLEGESLTGAGAGRRALPSRDVRLESREDVLKGLTGGTEGLNRAALDPLVSGPLRTAASRDLAAAHLRPNYLGFGPAEQTELTTLAGMRSAGLPMTPAQMARLQALEAIHGRSFELADFLHGLAPEYAASAGSAQPLRYFGHHPLSDLGTYSDRIDRLLGSAEASHNLLASQANWLGHGATLPAGHVRLTDALSNAGLDSALARDTLASRIGARVGAPITAADLPGFSVGQDIARDLTRYLKPFTGPDAASNLLAPFDWLTNFTKAHLTTYWPGFHVRNRITGIAQNTAKGGGDLGFEASALLAGKPIAGAAQISHLPPVNPATGLPWTDLEATRYLGREMMGEGALAYRQGISRDVVGRSPLGGAETLDELMGRVPGYTPQTYGSALGEVAGGKLNPLAGEEFGLIKGGRALGDVVEGNNRASLYLNLRKQGYTPTEAAKETIAAHFDYTRGGKTSFENDVMKRLFPFYTFTRGNIPLMLEQAAQRPGSSMTGLLGRAALDMRQQEGFLPDYLGQGLAIPLGAEDQGTRRYLTKTDLPPEQAFELLKGGPKWLQNTMMGVMAQSNPLLRAPVEYATGKQFYTGREAEDLYSMTGNHLAETAIMNSPFSRWATTARTLADERKWAEPLALPLNLASGLKVSDVDMARQRDIAAREVVQQMLRGQPEVGKFEQLYVRPGMEQYLSPQEIELLRLNRTLETKALQAARARQQGGR